MANIFYDKSDMPAPGSLQEAVCMEVFRARTERDVVKTFAIARASGVQLDKELMDKYMEAEMPYINDDLPSPEEEERRKLELIGRISHIDIFRRAK